MNALSTVKKTINRDENTNTRVMLARAIAQNTPAESLYQMAVEEHDPQQRLELLREVLAIDPYYQPAIALWEQTAREASVLVDAVQPPPYASLVGAVNIFARHGWELKVQLPRIAQLQKRRGLPVGLCAISILLLSVPALLVVLMVSARRRTARVHLQLDTDGILTVMHDRTATKIESSADLAAVAASVPDGISTLWAIFFAALSILGWATVL